MFPDEEVKMKDNITDYALNEYHVNYTDITINKEDIFYYIYGILHHQGYREKYHKSLIRGLPHIPMAPKFWPFSKMGRELAELHLNFDTCNRYNLGEPLNQIPNNPTKIKFGRKMNDRGKKEDDHSILKIDGIVIYENLPNIKYKVNGRTPVGWLTFKPKPYKDKNGVEIINRAPFRTMSGKEMRAKIERMVYVGMQSDIIIENLSKLEFEPKEILPIEKPANLETYM